MTFSLDIIERRFHFDASGAAFPSAARLPCSSTIHDVRYGVRWYFVELLETRWIRRKRTLDKANAPSETAEMNFPNVREVLTELGRRSRGVPALLLPAADPPARLRIKSPWRRNIRAGVKMLPLAGCADRQPSSALLLLLVTELGLTPQIAAIFAIFTLIIVTGAFHEDGLADFADSTGGATPEQRLIIMKDSRIGTFGMLALLASVLLRIFTVSILARHNNRFGRSHPDCDRRCFSHAGASCRSLCCRLRARRRRIFRPEAISHRCGQRPSSLSSSAFCRCWRAPVFWRVLGGALDQCRRGLWHHGAGAAPARRPDR